MPTHDTEARGCTELPGCTDVHASDSPASPPILREHRNGESAGAVDTPGPRIARSYRGVGFSRGLPLKLHFARCRGNSFMLLHRFEYKARKIYRLIPNEFLFPNGAYWVEVCLLGLTRHLLHSNNGWQILHTYITAASSFTDFICNCGRIFGESCKMVGMYPGRGACFLTTVTKITKNVHILDCELKYVFLGTKRSGTAPFDRNEHSWIIRITVSDKSTYSKFINALTRYRGKKQKLSLSKINFFHFNKLLKLNN